MPGILPMKMIRVGSSAQSRIAQACDRCRSKKIRCDGVRPTCTQCSNVGFECKTSDKLSRRAFPRGYTESLEDRVRGLEAEVRELKDLLDKKDEKIDLLSRIHNFSSPSRNNSASLSPPNSVPLKAEVEAARDEVLHVEIPAPVQPGTTSTGTSTASAFLEAFEQKLQESEKQSPNIAVAALLSEPQPRQNPANTPKTLPRILSDQYINIFFQEWQPLLPIVHRPTFLRIYEQYLLGTESNQWHQSRHAVAQLYLIFEIAALSSRSQNRQNLPSYEQHWKKALYSTSSTLSIGIIQSQVLAQLCYLLRADYTHLARHRGIAVGMCHELGLHQRHRYQTLSTLEAETRKKVFWCQYVLDKFISAATSSPTLLRDSDITTEYPADVDDENVSNQGFSPVLPGELTKVSSALALFRVSKILSKTLENLYPAKASYQLSLSKLHALSDELDQWSEELPEHLRLRFCNDKPATNVISCRSPLLSLAYFFTRSLIHRPLLCHGSGNAASAATIVLAAAGKHVLQILDLLDERRMNYTFPLNRRELVLTSALSILWQCLDLEKDSKLIKDNVKSLTLALGMLARENPVAAIEFQRVASSFVSFEPVRLLSPKTLSVDNPAMRLLNSMPIANDAKSKSTRKQLQAIASRISQFSNKGKEEQRRATVPQTNMAQSVSPLMRNGSSLSLSSTRSAPVATTSTPPTALQPGPCNQSPTSINLDYFPIGEDASDLTPSMSASMMLPPQKQTYMSANVANASWENLLTGFEGLHNMYLNTVPDGSNTIGTTGHDWMQDGWVMPSNDYSSKAPPVPQSLLSFSGESLTSGEDQLFSASSHNGSSVTNDVLETVETYKGITVPIDDDFDFNEVEA